MGPPPVGLAHVAALAAGAHGSQSPGWSLSSSGLSLGELGRLLLCAPYSLLVLPGNPAPFLAQE